MVMGGDAREDRKFGTTARWRLLPGMPERWLTLHEIATAIFEENRTATKEQFVELVARRLDLVRDRSVFVADDLAVRFAYASHKAFSNTVVSLANIKKYDERPFLVCVLRPDGVETLLANASLIARVAHSSQKLTVKNIRGSILGMRPWRSSSRPSCAPPPGATGTFAATRSSSSSWAPGTDTRSGI
jgi:hypothetical protein